MTLNEARINQPVRITKIRNCPLSTERSLQEMGLFCGENMCKLHENRNKCSIFRIHGCNCIMLDTEFSKLIEVETPSKKKDTLL